MKWNHAIRAVACLGLASVIVDCEKKPDAKAMAAQEKDIPAKQEESIPPAMKKKAGEVIAAYGQKGFELVGRMNFATDGRVALMFQWKMPAGEYPPPDSDRLILVNQDLSLEDRYGGPVILDEK